MASSLRSVVGSQPPTYPRNGAISSVGLRARARARSGSKESRRRPGIRARGAVPGWAAGLALALLLQALGDRPALAQERKVGVVTGLAGEATVVHASYPQPKSLRFQDDIFFKDRIETQQESVAKILLGGKAILTVRELSTVTITEEPRRSIVDFLGGRLALQVIKNLFAMGESVEVHTPNAVAAVRGSLLVVEMTGPAGAPEAHFTALEAHVPIVVTPRGDPSRAVQLTPNQSVSVSGLGRAARISPVRRVSPAAAMEHRRILNMPAHRNIREQKGPGQNVQGRLPDPRGRGQGQWGPGQEHGPGLGQDQRGSWQDRGQGAGPEKTPRWKKAPVEGARAFDDDAPAPQLREDNRPLRFDRPAPLQPPGESFRPGFSPGRRR